MKPRKQPKNRAITQFVHPRPKQSHSWDNGARIELLMFIKSLQTSARTLLRTLDGQESVDNGWDVGPIILLYRQAVEIRLKFLVDAGCGFIESAPDYLTLAKTHSLRWLAQFVCQIVRAVAWEAEFQCAGVSDLEQFSELITVLETMEPVSAAIHANKSKLKAGELPPQLKRDRVLEIVPKLDALLDLLAATAHGLVARAAILELGDSEGSGMVQ